MGFFDSLFGSRKRSDVEILPDRIWLTTDAKFGGLAKDVDARSTSEAVAILLVAHFPDVLVRLEEIANRLVRKVPVRAVLAGNLNAELAASLNLAESALVDITVGERHPLPSVDERLEEFAYELPCRSRFSHHISLEDPVMKLFAGEWTRNILAKLGMKEGEAIESKMVSRRIRQAQKKIEGRAIGNLDAGSANEWLEKNCPEWGSE